MRWDRSGTEGQGEIERGQGMCGGKENLEGWGDGVEGVGVMEEGGGLGDWGSGGELGGGEGRFNSADCSLPHHTVLHGDCKLVPYKSI